MRPQLRLLLLLIVAALLCATAVYAQTEDLIQDYTGGMSFFSQLFRSVLVSGIYLAFFAAALVITLSYLKLFSGFDSDVIVWIVLLWIGGIVLHAVAFSTTVQFFPAYAGKIGPVFLVPALVSVPMTFIWGLIISTRSFADLTLKDAWRVALVVAVVCAPYFTPTSFFTPTEVKPAKPAEETSALPQAPAMLALAPIVWQE